MYDFHYNFVKKCFDSKLLFTDIDSLTYEIKSEDVYEEFLSIKICLTLVTIRKIQSLIKINCHNSRTSDDIHMKPGPVTKPNKRNKRRPQKN